MLTKSFGIIRAFQQIIDTHMVQIRKGTKNVRRNHPLTRFVISIRPLGDVDGFSDLCLCHIMVFPQVSYSGICFHKDHRKKYIPEQIVLLMFRLNCSKIGKVIKWQIIKKCI